MQVEWVDGRGRFPFYLYCEQNQHESSCGTKFCVCQQKKISPIPEVIRIKTKCLEKNWLCWNWLLFFLKTEITKKNDLQVFRQAYYINFVFFQFSKAPLFSVCFSRELRIYKKQKKSAKDQRNFCSNTFFKVFVNSVSANSKI